MTAIAVLAAIVLAGLGIAWARMTTARVERRSVHQHEHRLDVLGHVAKRSDAVANVHTPGPDELARPHVRPADQGTSNSPLRPVALPRIRLDQPTPMNRLDRMGVAFERASSMVRKASQDDDEQPLFDVEEISSSDALPVGLESENIIVARFDDEAESPLVDDARRSSRRLRSSTKRAHSTRRAATGVAAAVVVGAMGVGGWQLAVRSNRDHQHSTAENASSRLRAHGGSSSGFAGGSTIQPIAVSRGLLTYSAPSNTYTVTFTATSPCWLGIEQSAALSNGPWLAMKTLAATDTWTYQATGPVVVRIGAPQTLSVTVDGQSVKLSGSAQPYDIEFVPQSTASI